MTLHNDALYQMRIGYRRAVQIDEKHETSRNFKWPQNPVSIIKQEIGILSSVLFRHVVKLHMYIYLSTIVLQNRTITSYHRAISPPMLPSHLPRTVPPYRTTVPGYRTTVPGYRTTVPWYRTTVPGYRTTVPYHRTRVPYHRTVPPYHRTVPPYLLYPVLSVPDLTLLFHTYFEL